MYEHVGRWFSGAGPRRLSLPPVALRRSSRFRRPRRTPRRDPPARRRATRTASLLGPRQWPPLAEAQLPPEAAVLAVPHRRRARHQPDGGDARRQVRAGGRPVPEPRPRRAPFRWKTMRLRNYSSPATPAARWGSHVAAAESDPGRPHARRTTRWTTRSCSRHPAPGAAPQLAPQRPGRADRLLPATAIRGVQRQPREAVQLQPADGSARADRPELFQCDPSDASRTCRMATIEQAGRPTACTAREGTNLHYHGLHVCRSRTSDSCC